MSIKVINSGLLTTVQDLGRFKLQKYGVIVGGAMDPLALRLGNMLVGNDEGEAGLEITMFGTEFYFNHDHVIAITGADLSPKINQTKEAPMWRPFLMKKGETLKFNHMKTGIRAYLTISGGIDLPKVMGSKSTYTQAKLGGYKGRPLKENDVIKIGEPSEKATVIFNSLQGNEGEITWFLDYYNLYHIGSEKSIRVLKGSEFYNFKEESRQSFFNHAFEISLNADRMGYQLEGDKLGLKVQRELLSEGVTHGTIQVPKNGRPIILMVERQTIGGYPKIAQVITVDLPRLAQKGSKNTITFKEVSIQEAEELLMERERRVSDLKTSINMLFSL